MRTIASVLAVCALVVAMADAAGAQTKSGKQKPYAKRYTQGEAASYSGQNARNGYNEHVADNLRFGSQAWWNQMQREGRLGGERP